MSVYYKHKKFIEHEFQLEKEFEEHIYANAENLFGPNVILLEAKKKIDSGELGRAIPDGFLFDFTDPADPKFYLIEVELQSHDFYRHIFPQITKFFAFLRSDSAEQVKLADSLYRVIESDAEYKKRFSSYLGGRELFKFLKDLIEESADILLIIDGMKPEIEEIKITYAETWGKYVKLMECRTYRSSGETIILCEPDFEIVDTGARDYVAPDDTDEDANDNKSKYDEEYHLSDANEAVRGMYAQVKEAFPNSEFNSQKYYISIRDGFNFAYLTLRKKLLRFVVLMPRDEVMKYVKHYHVREPSAGVMRFYNAKCCEIKVSDPEHFDEILKVLKIMQKYEIKRIR